MLRDLWEILLKIIHILLERFFKPWWILFSIIIVVFWKNWSPIFSFLSKLSIDQLKLIKDYIGILTAWPILTFVLSLIFIYKYSASIRKFLETHELEKIGPLDFGKNANIPQTEKDVSKEEVSKEEGKTELLEFYFLDKGVLVYNTKLALAWIYRNDSSHSATKQEFIQGYELPPTILNHSFEKETELSVLKSYNLLKEQNDKLMVTERGERFLKAAGYIY